MLAKDSIRYGNVFRSHSMCMDQICCGREYEEYRDGAEGGINIHYLELVPSDGAVCSLKIPKHDFDLDNTFWEWVLRVPDFEHIKMRPLVFSETDSQQAPFLKLEH